MNSSELAVNMSRQEIKTLKEKARFPLIFYLFQLFFGGIWISFLSMEFVLPKLVFGISIPAFFLFFNFVAFRWRRTILLDIKSGQKKVVSGPLEGKREDSSGYSCVYYLTLNKQEFAVLFFDWKLPQINQAIEVHVAINCGHIFAVKLLDMEEDRLTRC
jgi:hypothetical protein